jgi:hypothetical protein
MMLHPHRDPVQEGVLEGLMGFASGTCNPLIIVARAGAGLELGERALW